MSSVTLLYLRLCLLSNLYCKRSLPLISSESPITVVLPSLWEKFNITRSGGRMITVAATVVENIVNFNLIFEDMMKIVETVHLLKKG